MSQWSIFIDSLSEQARNQIAAAGISSAAELVLFEARELQHVFFLSLKEILFLKKISSQKRARDTTSTSDADGSDTDDEETREQKSQKNGIANFLLSGIAEDPFCMKALLPSKWPIPESEFEGHYFLPTSHPCGKNSIF